MAISFESARDQFGDLGVDVEQALRILTDQHISVHCWQGDDLGGFESAGAKLDGGGIQVTGNFPGKARNLEELRADLEKVYGLVPGRHRLNLHASYGDFSGERADRDQIEPEHFASWTDWGAAQNIPLDFNATLFSHPRAEDGFTLSHKDPAVRQFWIDHVKQARKIAASIGKRQGSPCIHNIWIPDGSRDLPVDRFGHRQLLTQSLDEILQVDYPADQIRDAVEPKLFGIGSEAFVVGSHEFYLGYALTRDLMICLDMGHFHPTESVADKISAYFQFKDELLLHVSRPLRWDSDHVVVYNDELRALAEELVRADALAKTHIGLDFFDATINRIGAYALGTRATLKAVLAALLEPRELLLGYEEEGNLFARLALLEEAKTLPLGPVWEEYCRRAGVPGDRDLIREVMDYEHAVLSRRN